jgi:hypothetical protein
MILTLIVLSFAEVTAYTSKNITLYDANCNRIGSMPVAQMPKPPAVVMPQSPTCPRHSIMLKDGRQVWLDGLEIEVKGPPCVAVADRAGGPAVTGGNFGAGTGGQVCIKQGSN